MNCSLFKEDNSEFSMANPKLVDLDLGGSDNMSSVTATSTLLLPNKQFYEICCQSNESQQHLLSFMIQYTLHCKLAEKNDE